MHTKYTNREIWKVAYPILISLIMEQLIGMTDTAFMGRVGEVELGASAIAGVYYLAIFMLGFGFSIGSQILIARRNGEGNFRMIGPIFYQGIYFLLVMALVMFTLSRLFSPWILSHVVGLSPRLRGSGELHQLAGVRLLLLVRGHHVPGVLCGNHTDQDPYAKLHRHGDVERSIQLYSGVRETGISGTGHCRSRHRLFTGGTGIDALFHHLHHTADRLCQIRAEPAGQFPVDGAETHHERVAVDYDTERDFHQHLVPLFHLHRAPGRTFTGHHQHCT